MSPDGSAKPLPEERLLRLIRGKAARPASSPAPSAAVVLGQGMGRVPRARRWPQMAAMGLGAVLLLELLLLIIEAFRPAPTITMPVVQAPPDTSPSPPVPLPAMPSLAQSTMTPLFSTPMDTPDSPGQTLTEPCDAVTKLAARLTLLGIVAGTPAQAIIEDSQAQKTYFVSPGQVAAEGAVVGEILDNRVMLDLKGCKLELSL